jgi:hypothetical protein
MVDGEYLPPQPLRRAHVRLGAGPLHDEVGVRRARGMDARATGGGR